LIVFSIICDIIELGLIRFQILFIGNLKNSIDFIQNKNMNEEKDDSNLKKSNEENNNKIENKDINENGDIEKKDNEKNITKEFLQSDKYKIITEILQTERKYVEDLMKLNEVIFILYLGIFTSFKRVKYKSKRSKIIIFFTKFTFL
jgi:hypothetical protein